MTTTGTGDLATSPFAPPPPRPWYRRRTAIVVAAVLVVVAVTVVTDLPTNPTRSNDVATAQAVVTEIANDVKPCDLGTTEAFGFYADVTTGHITAAHRAQIPALIRDDLDACSYTNASIDDLAGIDNPSSPTGDRLNTIATDVLVWCDPDALTAIGDITILLDRPGDARALAELAHAETLLREDRARAAAAVSSLARRLGTTFTSPPVLASTPSPTSGPPVA